MKKNNSLTLYKKNLKVNFILLYPFILINTPCYFKNKISTQICLFNPLKTSFILITSIKYPTESQIILQKILKILSFFSHTLIYIFIIHIYEKVVDNYIKVLKRLLKKKLFIGKWVRLILNLFLYENIRDINLASFILRISVSKKTSIILRYNKNLLLVPKHKVILFKTKKLFNVIVCSFYLYYLCRLSLYFRKYLKDTTIVYYAYFYQIISVIYIKTKVTKLFKKEFSRNTPSEYLIQYILPADYPRYIINIFKNIFIVLSNLKKIQGRINISLGYGDKHRPSYHTLWDSSFKKELFLNTLIKQ